MAPSATITESAPPTVMPVKAKQVAGSALNCNIENGMSPSGLHKIPTFPDKYAERTWAKQLMAAAFRTFARLGYADGASGHISVRDPVNPHHFWINPYGKHFATMRASDMILIDHEGRPVEETNAKVNAAGFIIHSTIHKARPDINAVCHAHSPYGRAWSTFGRNIEMINQDSCMFYKNTGVYEGFGGVVLAAEEGQHISNALGPTNMNLILQNHGLLTCGTNVGEAAAYFIALERACQAQILAESAAANGIPKRLVNEEAATYSYEFSKPAAVMYMQFAPEFDLTVELSDGKVLL